MTPEYCEDNLTIPQLDAMNKYWGKHPPTHLLVAAYLEYEKEEGDLGDLFDMLPVVEPPPALTNGAAHKMNGAMKDSEWPTLM